MTEVRLPGSKSVTARALFLAAAASGRTVLREPLRAADTRAFLAALTALGYPLAASGCQMTRTMRGWRCLATARSSFPVSGSASTSVPRLTGAARSGPVAAAPGVMVRMRRGSGID